MDSVAGAPVSREVLGELKMSCQDKAQSWEAAQKGRAEELQALANAKQVRPRGTQPESAPPAYL